MAFSLLALFSIVLFIWWKKGKKGNFLFLFLVGEEEKSEAFNGGAKVKFYLFILRSELFVLIGLTESLSL